MTRPARDTSYELNPFMLRALLPFKGVPMRSVGPSLPSGASPTGDRLLYREDDAHFKQRLVTTIQLYWVYNSALTIIICAVVVYLLHLPLLIGIVLGLLILLVSNIQQTMWRMGRATRWEVFRNMVVIPSRTSSGRREIHFEDIASVQRHKSLVEERVVLKLRDGSNLTFAVEEQERPLSALETAFRNYTLSRASPPVLRPDAEGDVVDSHGSE